jgi:hypothetical protein
MNALFELLQVGTVPYLMSDEELKIDPKVEEFLAHTCTALIPLRVWNAARRDRKSSTYPEKWITLEK